ncbi:type II toxin-antitoxin system PemK/MazF family toxin [Hominenteromicrobium sp.]|uniref:type II toxin-antitoxin system PemK/MazF family toxin n=1 Tax=Hominenteromicrobium sp. TaxID=3073581 RepID=UPI0039938FE3
MKENWNYHRGDIYLVDLGTNIGSEQGGCRPVLLVQNDIGNHFGPTLIVAPVSSRYWKKSKQPTHTLIEGIQNLSSPSVVLAEQLLTIDKVRVMKYLGKVPEDQMQNVNKAVMVSLGLEQPDITRI